MGMWGLFFRFFFFTLQVNYELNRFQEWQLRAPLNWAMVLSRSLELLEKNLLVVDSIGRMSRIIFQYFFCYYHSFNFIQFHSHSTELYQIVPTNYYYLQ